MTSRLHPASIHALRALALACLAATCLTGCPAEEPGGADAGPADTFTMLYQTIGGTCRGCHAEGAIGAPVGTEATQDWTTVESARASLRGTASGLMGNFAGCNGVPLLGDTPETSLLVASLDEDVRAEFSLAEFPDCNTDAISDMELKIGRPISAAELSLLRQFVMEEAGQ
jgi:cytochrome c5